MLHVILKCIKTYISRILTGEERNCATMFTEGIRPQVSKEDITLPSGYKDKLAFLLHNVLTEEVGK